MPLTTSDTFSRVRLKLSGDIVRLSYDLTDGSWDTIYFDEGELPDGHAQQADVDVLREIYASADGFQDGDGNDLAVLVGLFYRDGTAVNDPALLEANGFPNPLLTGTYERLANLNKVRGALLLEGSVEEDATTARRDIKLKGGVIPETRTPESGALMVSLEDINILVFNSDTFITRLLFSSDEAPTDATLGDSAYVKAFLSWLDANHYSGTAVNLTATTTTQVEAAIGGNRVYQYAQDDGELVRFSYSGDIVFLNSFREMQLYWTIASASPGTFNSTEFEEALDDELITVDGITDPQEKPPFGSTEIEVNALRLNMDRMRLENASDYPVIEYRDESNKKRRLIVGYGASMNYADLLIGTYNVTTTPKTWGINAIHFGPDETANGTTRLRTPIDQIPEAWQRLGVHVPQSEHHLLVGNSGLGRRQPRDPSAGRTPDHSDDATRGWHRRIDRCRPLLPCSPVLCKHPGQPLCRQWILLLGEFLAARERLFTQRKQPPTSGKCTRNASSSETRPSTMGLRFPRRRRAISTFQRPLSSRSPARSESPCSWGSPPVGQAETFQTVMGLHSRA